MFVKDSVKGAAIWNGLIFAAITVVAVVGTMAMLKFKPVPNADGTPSGSLKATLDLKKS